MSSSGMVGEYGQLLALWTEIEARPVDAILATVVAVQGSSYRRPGAHVLVTIEGRKTGSISGGCLEGDLSRKAWWWTEQVPLVTRRYDTASDEEGSGGFGLGCGGTIDVMIERVAPGVVSPLSLLGPVRADRRARVVVTVSNADAARRYALGERCVFTAGEIDERDEFGKLAAHALRRDASGLHRLPSGAEVFVEVLRPPLRLYVCGAGDDAQPLTRLAGFLGWQPWVLDGRPQMARPERFPDAAHVQTVDLAGELPADCVCDDRTAAVVMTHSYAQDLYFLQRLTSRPVPYLGVLGPRRRTEQLLQDAGVPNEQWPAIHAPVGIDLGAETPEEVALAIVSEIQAVREDRAGGLLRAVPGPIHDRSAHPDASNVDFARRSCALA